MKSIQVRLEVQDRGEGWKVYAVPEHGSGWDVIALTKTGRGTPGGALAELACAFYALQPADEPGAPGDFADGAGEAKLFAYYLRVNIAAYEAVEGKIKVPDGAIPDQPKTQKAIWDEFVGSLPDRHGPTTR